MLTLALRRARVQRGMLVAVVGLIAAGACLIGVCTLLLTATQTRAFHAEVERAQPDDVDVTAYLVELPGSELQDARSRAGGIVADVLAPMRPTVTASAVGVMRRLDDDRVAYLATDDDLGRRAVLASGRWPDDTGAVRPEAVVPAAAARILGLRLGDTVTLGDELVSAGVPSVAEPVTVVVVGTFQPRPGGGWDTDPLSGQGYTAVWSHGSTSPAAYGPFVVGDRAFRASGSYVAGLRVTAHPTLSLARPATLGDAADGIARASTLLTEAVEDRVRITRVGSNLPGTLDRIDAQQATTRATVLVVGLLGVALAVAAALLAGWLVAASREDERTLLVALGQSRRQQLAAGLVEAGLLALVGTALAVPAAALAHSLLTHTAGLRAAGLAQRPTITLPLVAGVAVTSLLVALALVLTALDSGTGTERGSHRRAAVRGGLDALLLVIAVAGWWQLRTQPASDGGIDVVATLAPVLCFAAMTLLAVRLVPLGLGALARVGLRSRGLILPLAAQQAARRPHTGTAMVAIAAAVAAATFGVGLGATWKQSQEDQAALRLGTDLSLAPAATAGEEVAEKVGSAAGRGALGPAVSPVIDRSLTLGSYAGRGGPPPVLVGVDTTQAGELLRGRLQGGTTWSQIGDLLAPESPAQGIPLPPDGTGVEVEADAPADADLSVTVTAVLQDPAGIRSSVNAAPLPMDGRTHRASWLGAVGSDRLLVGVRLELAGPSTAMTAPVSVSLRVPGTTPQAGAGTWDVQTTKTGDGTLSSVDVAVRDTGTSTVVRTTASASLSYFSYSTNSVLVTSLPAPPAVPVAVSQDLVDAVGASVGTRLATSQNGIAIPLEVAAIVPDVPSAPGRLAVLADSDLLSRALVDAGQLDPGYDAWWIGDPSPRTVAVAEQLGVGDVTTRTELATQLATGPMRVAVPTALLTLVAAASVLLLLSVGLLLAGDLHRRTAEASRLRALGLAAREARRVLLAEDAAFLLPVVVAGTLVGRVTSGLLSPGLVRSDLGGSPIPAAVEVWPWGSELALVGAGLVGALGIAAALTAAHVRRGRPARLRTGDAR